MIRSRPPRVIDNVQDVGAVFPTGHGREPVGLSWSLLALKCEAPSDRYVAGLQGRGAVNERGLVVGPAARARRREVMQRVEAAGRRLKVAEAVTAVVGVVED